MSSKEASIKSLKSGKQVGTHQVIIGKDLFGGSLFACHRFQKSENPKEVVISKGSKATQVDTKKEKSIYIGPDLYINPNYIVAIPSYTRSVNRGGQISKKSKENLKSNRVKGELSKASRKKLRSAINWLVAAGKRHKVWSKKRKKHFTFKFAIITLTVPRSSVEISDHRFKAELLGKFIDWMRKSKAVKNYIWKVEPQKDGTIHAHIIINQFIHYNDVRREWLKILGTTGVVERSAYRKRLQDIPCSEIKPVVNVKKLGAYLAAYMNKKHEGRRLIIGRLWACNYELSSKNKLVIRADAFDTSAMIQWWKKGVVKVKDIEIRGKIEGEVKKIGEVALLKARDWQKTVGQELRDFYETHLWNIRHQTQSLPLSYYQL